MIIHISGFPGSGKTTLGKQLATILPDKFIIQETDEFIQHHNTAGKQLLKLESEIDRGLKPRSAYKTAWRRIMKRAINAVIAKHPNKNIIFVGSLTNFAPRNTIYPIHADYKFLLTVPLNTLTRRYFLRIAEEENTRTKQQSINYWNKIASGEYSIASSEYIINNYDGYNSWHKSHGYIAADDKTIISSIKKIAK